MHIEVSRTMPELTALAGEWNYLLESGASHVPFLRHEYLSTWWQTRGGGEWPESDLYTLTGRKPDGTLAGVAPLFFTQNRDGEPALMLLGSIEISDYLDVIASREDLPEFIDCVLDYLGGASEPAWQVLDFYNLFENSPTLEALRASAEGKGWAFRQEVLQHCPYIPLPGDWETYLEGIDKKQRHEIRRKMRRAETSDLPVRFYIVEDGDHLADEVEAFLKLMAYDDEKAQFLTDAMRTQFHASAQQAFMHGWLQLSFMEVGGEKAAGYMNFDYAGHIWVYNSGIDFRYRDYSPGWVLLGYLLQWANEHKRQAFDFMRGDEDYKYRFGAVDRRVVRAVVRR